MSNTDKESFILITLDSCRYDTYLRAHTSNFDKIGQVHKAYAPGNFTLPSHMAMFCGFTPGDPKSEQDFVNPKIKRLWKLGDDVQADLKGHLMVLPGINIVDGFNKLGYTTIGTGGVGWFDPARIASLPLIDRFQHFEYFGQFYYLRQQIEWIEQKIEEAQTERKFIFLNIGETHSPYWHEGAEWNPLPHPCKSFGKENSREKAEYRQKKCLEYADTMLEGLLNRVTDYNIIICGDHGDAWGEDSLWEHSIHHEKVYEVPLVLRINSDLDFVPMLKRAIENRDNTVNDEEVSSRTVGLSNRQMSAMEKELYRFKEAWEERGEWIKRLEEAKDWLASQNERLKDDLAKSVAAWEERGKWIEHLEEELGKLTSLWEERGKWIEQLEAESARATAAMEAKDKKIERLEEELAKFSKGWHGLLTRLLKGTRIKVK